MKSMVAVIEENAFNPLSIRLVNAWVFKSSKNYIFIHERCSSAISRITGLALCTALPPL